PFIQQSIDTLCQEGLLGLAFAGLGIAVFLLSVRSTPVTAVSIPLPLLAAPPAAPPSRSSLTTLPPAALPLPLARP
ncbi:hypothetical protein R0J91_23030, partial [Micrococcus sp. SIMBA_131]